MDRNNGRLRAVQNTKVALRKESVDRNTSRHSISCMIPTSLSVRRAWIEIVTDEVSTNEEQVALRKESVDRNLLS